LAIVISGNGISNIDVILEASQKHLLTAQLNDDERRQLQALVKGAEGMRRGSRQWDATES
jgi:hypothetical protein